MAKLLLHDLSQGRHRARNEIFVALHLTAGLPGRGTEITSIRLRNTKLATRNVFVREGQILIVISYSKSRASNNHAFYTVRYLPKDLACAVLAYLTYIRPFIDFLANRLELPQFRSNKFFFHIRVLSIAGSI